MIYETSNSINYHRFCFSIYLLVSQKLAIFNQKFTSGLPEVYPKNKKSYADN